MSKIRLSELRNIIREELINTLVEFETKDMPNGTSWKVAGTGWAAKNSAGETNYWYSKDETKNKEAASAFSKGSSTVKNNESLTAVAAGAAGLYRGYKGAKRAAEKTTDAGPRSGIKSYMKNFAKGALGIDSDNAEDLKVTNPKTGKEIFATTAYDAGSSHPAYAAAKKVLKK